MHSHENPPRRPGAVKLLSALVTLLVLGALIIASRSISPWTQIAAAGDKATANAVVKANAFLETLDAKQKEKALLDFDSAKKPSWSNLPVTFVPRNGLALSELTKPQRAAALELVAAVLSKEGYQKAIDIMNADDQLVKDKENKMKFGTEHFYIALFGAPSTTKPWMMQFGGHHLGINVTMMGKDAVLTPTHTGAQPDSFQRDGKTVRPLGSENDLAFKLVNMLNADQKKQVVLGAKPKNLVLGPKEDNKKSDPEGIKCSALDKAQRAVLMDVIAAWVNMLPADAAARRKAEIEKKLDDTHFVWYGPTTNGSAAYYKIQGPNVHIEYAPQGGVSHIHTIIRDPSNDYGKELIKRN
jgi:hypothetical protein